MKIHEASERHRVSERTGARRLLSYTSSFASMLARRATAGSSGIAYALWASIGWAQQPPAVDAPPAAEPAPAEAAPPTAAPGPSAAPVDAALPDASAASSAEAPIDEPLPEDVPIDATDGSAQSGMDEVIITVDRRKKDLQDYSGTASAFSESQLKNIGVTSVMQMSQVVPGVQIGVNEQGSATIYIRGVGSDNTTELGDSAVAVHVDNVYLPRSRGLNAAYLDVERVEVNSGPQGTVRGRNATGGSINIISKPAVLGEFQTSAEATFGTYRQRTFQGMLNIPIGEHVALRAAGASNHMDETWENAGPLEYLPGSQNADDYAFKGQLRIKPTSQLDIVLAGDYTLQRSAGWNGANMIGLLNNQNDNDTPLDQTDDFLDPINPDTLDNPRRVFRRGRYPSARTEHWGVRANVNYDTGPFTIELLGSYRFQDWDLISGSNAGYFPDPEEIGDQNWDSWSFASQQDHTSKSMVGEIRFASPDDQRVVWSLGLFGFYEDQAQFLGQITGDPDGGFNEFNMPSIIGYSYAGYGDVTFKVTEDWRVFAGLRYSVEHKDRLGGLWMIGSNLPQVGLGLCAEQNTQGQCTNEGLASVGIGRFGTEGFEYKGLSRDNYSVPGANSTAEERVNFFLDGIGSFGERDETAIALCNDPPPETQLTTGGTGSVINIPARLETNEDGNFRCAFGVRPQVMNNFTNPRPQNGERDDDYFDFRVGTEYDATKDNLLYLTLSSGHKSGGFNDSIPNPDSAGDFLTPDYGPETVYALEVGSKNLMMDRKLRLNASAFAYRYADLQFQTIITVGEAPPLDAQGNVAIDPETGEAYPDNRGGSAARQNAQNTALMYGLDVDAVYSLPAGLEVDLHALFQDSRFPDDTLVNDGRLGLGTAPAQVDIGGYWLPRVAPYTFNYSLSQLIPTVIGNFDWIVQGQTRGPHFFTPFNGDGTRFAPRGPGWGVNPITGAAQPIEADDPNNPDDTFNQQYNVLANNLERLYDKVPTYTVVNVGFGWRRADGLLSIRGFVNNVFDTVYATNIGSTSGNNVRFFNDPRMAGIRIRADF
jgi:iron complex outermembrane recepter protein